MFYNSFFKQFLCIGIVLLLVSCDKDYNEIGDGLITDNNFDFLKSTSSVIAYTQKTGAVQSDNLATNAFGIYDNPAFGKTTANFATQLLMETNSTVIGANAVIDSVIISVPYFVDKTKTVLKPDGGKTYVLDSIYGPSDAKLKLSVYESGLYLRELDPVGGFVNPQKYFSDQNADFDNLKIGAPLNDAAEVEQNSAFFFNAAEIVEKTTDADGKLVITRSEPGMRLKLNNAFFTSKILNAPAGKLTSSDVFKEYFRGLYFKVENSGSTPGNMAIINFKNAKITIRYKEDLVTSGVTSRPQKTIVLNATANPTGKVVAVGLLNNNFATSGLAYNALPISGNAVVGDDKLFLKGGQGSLAVLSLFGADADNNGIADELELFRKNGWLINEADLVFYIDDASMVSSDEPQRIYLYDLTNNVPILDYATDVTSNSLEPKKSKTVYGGLLKKSAGANGRGVYYKIRITDHIRRLTKDNTTANVKLGLVVTEDISISSFNALKLPLPFSDFLPRASVMNPLGTVLFGGTSAVPVDKRLKLEVYYTKPN